MKRYGFILLILMSFFIIGNVSAQDIKSIKMDINIDKEGTAHVKESWNIYFDKNEDLTEVYKPYNDIGASLFSNFHVSLNGKDYTNIKWNIDKDFNYKKYKNGINYTSDGIELCWGISEKGKSNVYNISYDISNFVAKLNDADMVYWTLIPKNLADEPENIYIKIHSDFTNYSKDLPVWGYGKYGAPTYVYNGYIEMSTDEALNKDEYMTILVQFPKDTFSNNNYLDKNFNYYLDMANNGAKSYTDDSSTGIFEKIIYFIEEYFLVLIIIVISIIGVLIPKSRITGNMRIKFRKEDKKLPKEVNYFRDIPCNKDIYLAYWYIKTYRLGKKDTDILGAVLLKWLNEEKIEINKDMSTGIFKKEKSKIVLKNNITFDNPLEDRLYQMLVKASVDYVLEAGEFKKWASDHYSNILGWFTDILDEETTTLSEAGYLKKLSTYRYETTNMIYEEGLKLKEFKHFLLDFSRIHEKNPIEVHLWKEYLMFAQIFGLAEQVAKEFKDIYPDIIPDDYIDDFDFIYFVSYTGINSASTAKSRAESYDSGGGGFSSGGGGFGSFGGGGFGGGGGR